MMFFFPKTVETRISKINGTISVIKLFGKWSINAGGYTQSGGLVESIWKSVLVGIKKTERLVKPRILILGLGAGSSAGISAALWKDAKLTGIEIDPLMIKLGKTYLHLDQIANLRIIQSDAIAWIKKRAIDKRQPLFDLILVDLYLGGTAAPQVREPDFLKAINRLLKTNGLALFNYLIRSGDPLGPAGMKRALEETFAQVERLPSPANAIFSVGKRASK
ncbi:MAG TPA: hypothetical protein VJ521_16135 [Acidobacteriota bacterium]|nr:hypothetical protein [Acidobacteriota bacterium]